MGSRFGTVALSDGDVTSPLSPSGALPIIPSAPPPHHLIVDAPKALPLAPATVSTLVPVTSQSVLCPLLHCLAQEVPIAATGLNLGLVLVARESLEVPGMWT